MSSQDVRRSQRVAVPSSKVLENAPACVRVFWSYISEAVKSNTEDRTEIRTLIANIRKAYADLTEIDEPSEDVQRVYELMVDELRSTIVDLLSSGSECLSGISRRSRHKLELPTDKATHAFSQEQKKEKTLTHDDIMAETRIQYKSIVTTMGNPGKPSSHHRQNLPSVRCPLTEKTRKPTIEPAETYGMSRSKSHIAHALDNKHTTKAQLPDNRQHNHRRSQSLVSDVELQDERSSICQKRLLLEHELNELGRLEEELNIRRAQRATDELLLRRQEDRLNARSSQEESTSDIAKLAAALSESIQLSRMPQPEIPKFNGDPIEYHSWRATFDYLVTNRNIHPKEKLCFLQQSISDKVLKMTALKNLQSEEAFQRAMALLSEKFDDQFHVIESYRNMLSDFKPIAEHDHKRLQDFSDLLSQVEIAYETINGLDMLDDPHELTALSHKLPMHIRRKFASTFYNKKKQGFYPTFRELVNLVVTESALLNDPQIAQILQIPRTESQQERVFAASTTESAMTVVSRDSCKYCDAPGHMIVECRKLGKLTPKDKELYIKENRLCYGCLVQGHKSTACYKRSVCNECKGRHPTSIHGMYEALHPSSKPITNNRSDGSTRKERDTSNTTHTKDERDTSSSTTEKYLRHDAKNADTDDDEQKETVNAHNKRTMNTKASASVYTMIVPVYVSTKQQPTHEVLTYAMIDSQSDTSFITDSIAENLKAKSDDVNLSIMTMCSTTDVACKKYQGLQVRGMNASTIVTLPSMYGRDDIPSDISQVGTKETTLNHSHLHQIQHQVPSLQDCGIGILIGCDCSIVMTPLRVIPGSPLAQETCLGWSIVGSDERVSTKTMRTQTTNDSLSQSDDLKDKVVVTHHISKRDEFNYIDKGRLGVRGLDGQDGRTGRTGEASNTRKNECPGPQGPTCEQGFRVNHGDVGSDGAPGIPGRRGLSGDTCHTDSPGLIGLGEDLGSTVFQGPKECDGSIRCQGSHGATGATKTRDRQEPEFPTERIGHPDRVRDEERPALCGAPEGSGLVRPCGLNGLPDGRRRKGPIRAQRFPGQRGVCGITSCVGLRGMAGRQYDTGARGLPGANGHRDLTGLSGPTEYVYALKRWRQVQFDPGIFRSRWRSDYLLTLEPQWQLKY